eukprot:9464033-Alexandrium_andersonii.AAC.2
MLARVPPEVPLQIAGVHATRAQLGQIVRVGGASAILGGRSGNLVHVHRAPSRGKGRRVAETCTGRASALRQHIQVSRTTQQILPDKHAFWHSPKAQQTQEHLTS